MLTTLTCTCHEIEIVTNNFLIFSQLLWQTSCHCAVETDYMAHNQKYKQIKRKKNKKKEIFDILVVLITPTSSEAAAVICCSS